MADTKNDETVTYNMKVVFKNENEHKKLINGENYSNKGIRSNKKKGRYASQPDIMVISEAERDIESIREFDSQQEYLRTLEKQYEEEEEDELAPKIIKAIAESGKEVITSFFSDKKNKENLALLGNRLNYKVNLVANKTWSSIIEKASTWTEIIQSGFSGKTKTEQLLSESKERAKTIEQSVDNSIVVEPIEDIDDKSQYRQIPICRVGLFHNIHIKRQTKKTK